MSKLKFLCCLFALVLLAGGAAVVTGKAKLPGRAYTAKACLQLAPCEPHILPRAAEKFDPLEFESFRDTQQALIKSEYVITAALRDPRLKGKACIQREDEKHNAVAWLTGEIRVEFPSKSGGIMQVCATQPDPKDAADIVNAVVDAYKSVVVDHERQGRRDRLNELSMIYEKKDTEVREKRNQLKREREAIGAGDDVTAKARAQLAVQMYADFQREFLGMRAEHRNLTAKLQDAERAKKDLADDLTGTMIPEIQVAALLNNDPVYRDLQNRLALLELESNRPHIPTGTAAAEKSRIKADLEKTSKQLQELETHTREMIRAALRIELQNNVRRLESQLEISTGALAAFEKEVEKKANQADNVSRGTVNIQMERAEVENIEQILRAVALERETSKIELNAADRVTVLAAAAAPESPD